MYDLIAQCFTSNDINSASVVEEKSGADKLPNTKPNDIIKSAAVFYLYQQWDRLGRGFKPILLLQGSVADFAIKIIAVRIMFLMSILNKNLTLVCSDNHRTVDS